MSALPERVPDGEPCEGESGAAEAEKEAGLSVSAGQFAPQAKSTAANTPSLTRSKPPVIYVATKPSDQPAAV